MINQKDIERRLMIAMLKVENKFAEMEQKFKEMENANTTPQPNVPVQGVGLPGDPGAAVRSDTPTDY